MRDDGGVEFARSTAVQPGGREGVCDGRQSRLIAAFAQIIERGSVSEVDCYFREGAWTRFADIAGFEAALAEMVQPHLSTLDEKGFNRLEDAVGIPAIEACDPRARAT